MLQQHQMGEMGVQQAPEPRYMPPALPPRPPPRPRPVQDCNCPLQVDTPPPGVACSSPPTPAHYEPPPDHVPAPPSHSYTGGGGGGGGGAGAAGSSACGSSAPRRPCWSAALRKYVILCTACGGMAALLGALFLLVHFVLRAHTSSLHYFETVPTYVPAAMLTATGLVVMCFARRRNRYGYLIKVCGVCCLLCAVLCVVVTVTTTVIHMNRLQTLRECVYTQKTQACTCYSGLPQEPAALPSAVGDDGMHFVFHNTPDCEVVHGALYSCLRALFGLSVIGILVCIFSCMLVYQLLSHEKKKMYWEQLEMRCRYLYGRRNPPYAYCGCSCEECPRFPPPAAAAAATPHAELFPWPPWDQQGYLDDRYWSPPRVGNLYTPSPEEQSAAALAAAAAGAGNHPQQQGAAGGARWSWLPWNRGGAGMMGVGAAPRPPPAGAESGALEAERPLRTGDPDSQYGFGATARGVCIQTSRVGPVGPALCRPMAAQAFVTEASAVAAAGYPRYMWGPPPPYSQPPSTASNSTTASPARVVHDPAPQPVSCYPRHHHGGHHVPQPPVSSTPLHLLHHHHHHCSEPAPGSAHSSPQHVSPALVHSPSAGPRRSVPAGSPCCGSRLRSEEMQGLKALSELPTSEAGENNTLPSRKNKKRPTESPLAVSAALAAVKAASAAQHQGEGVYHPDSPGRKGGVGLASSLRGLFGSTPGSPGPLRLASRALPQSAPTSANNSPHKTALAALSPLRRLPPTPSVLVQPREATESEVYFADVSSCNGGPDSSLYDEPNVPSPEQGRRDPQYSSIPSPPPPGSRSRRAAMFHEHQRIAPDAQYDASAAPPEDDAPMRDSDATIDSGVHSGSEAALQHHLNSVASRLRQQQQPPQQQPQQQQRVEDQAPRSVNV